MQLNVPSDLETLINKRLSSGAYSSPEDVLRRALEVHDQFSTKRSLQSITKASKPCANDRNCLRPRQSRVGSREPMMQAISSTRPFPAALHNGIGLLPWSPLAGGFLTGKY
jgi:hypothetical protein